MEGEVRRMSEIGMTEFPNHFLHARWFTDPVCSWSFAAEEAIETFRNHFSGRLLFENRMYVLYQDLSTFLRHHGMESQADFAPKIEKVSRATGKSISAGAWRKGNIPSSSEDCCLWVKAAQSIDPLKGNDFLSGMRKALFHQEENVSSLPVLKEIARISGLDPDMLQKKVREEGCRTLLAEDMSLAAREGVETRPTLVLRNSGGDRVLIGGLMDPELFIHAGEVLLREA